MQDGEDGLLTIQEVAERLRVDVTTVRRWIKDGMLEAITLPHRNKRRQYRIRQSVFSTIVQNKSSASL